MREPNYNNVPRRFWANIPENKDNRVFVAYHFNVWEIRVRGEDGLVRANGERFTNVKKAVKRAKEIESAQTGRAIGSAKVFHDLETGEWVVKAYDVNGQRYEAADYFTTDKADATATARKMVNK